MSDNFFDKEHPETAALGLREEMKDIYSREGEIDPMGETFRAVGAGAHNLENVAGLRKQYPEEYQRRMTMSVIKPERPAHGWFAETFAGSVLKGVFDADEVSYLEQHFLPDNLGIPKEFIELPEVQKYMKTLANRPWANQEVNAYLRKRFNIPEEVEERHKKVDPLVAMQKKNFW